MARKAAQGSKGSSGSPAAASGEGQRAAASAADPGRSDLAEMIGLVIRELAGAPPDGAHARLFFPNGIQLIRASLSAASAELEISGQPTTPGTAAVEEVEPEPEPDFHEDDPDAEIFDAEAAAAAVAAAREPSGRAWVGRFPGSRSTADLMGGFREKVEAFLRSLTAAGATVRISATFRPPERAYLMHFAWEIARKNADPTRIPAMPGVNIEWAHRNAAGQVDRAASRRGAEEMVEGFGMAFQAALHSRHTERRAIDMSISWSGTLTLADASGRRVSIASTPRNGSNTALHNVGRTFGVIKLVKDPPHWSDDGH